MAERATNTQWKELGRGVRGHFDGKGKVTLELDTSDNAVKTAPMSKSGKNPSIASTGGFVSIGNVRLSLNVIPMGG